MAWGFASSMRGDVEAELETGTTPRHPHHRVTEALRGKFLAVGGRRERDAGVGMKVVDVASRHQSVHRGVDRRRRTAAPVHAEIERRDHLVFALGTGVHADERAQAVDAQHRESALLQGAEVARRIP